MLWTQAWVWVAGAIVLAILEVVMPTYMFMGFAAGALATSGLLYLNITMFTASLPMTLVAFAAISLVVWLVLRKVFGIRFEAVKTFSKEEDIND